MAAQISIPIRLILDQRKSRALWQGSEIVVPTREEIQNDAETLLSLLGVIDVARDEYAERESLIRRLKKVLRPMVRKGEAFDRPGEYELGRLELSEDEMKFLEKLLTNPPQVPDGRGGTRKIEVRGAMVDTFGDLREAIEDWRIERRQAERSEEVGREHVNGQAQPESVPA